MRRAFTLVEILLTIALIAAMTGLIAGAGLLNDDKSRPPDKIFMAAVKRARTEAMIRGSEISLFFDTKGFFVISDLETAEVIKKIYLNPKTQQLVEKAEKENVEVDWNSISNDVIVDFLPVYPELIRKGSVDFDDSKIVSHLRFYPDASMTPVKVTIQIADKDVISFELDPFSAAPRHHKPEDAITL